MKMDKKRLIIPIILIVVGGLGTLSRASILIRMLVHRVGRGSGVVASFIPPLLLSAGVLALGIVLLCRRMAETSNFWATNNEKKLPGMLKKVKRLKDEDRLYSVARGAYMSQVAEAAVARIQSQSLLKRLLSGYTQCEKAVIAAAMKRIDDEEALLSFLTESRCRWDELRDMAVEKLTSTAALEKVVMSAPPPQKMLALGRIEDRTVLSRIAGCPEATLPARVAAYEKLGDSDHADLETLLSRFQAEVETRRAAAERLLQRDDPELFREALERILATEADSVSLEFLGKAAGLHPELIRGRWPDLRRWVHADRNDHYDYTTKAPHVDSTQYYDFYRYPDGRTVPNCSGRRNHTDGPMPSSDCTTYGHTDNSSHTDADNTDSFNRTFPPAVRGEEA